MLLCPYLLKEKTPRKMRKRGLVWNHFAPLGDERAKCITCPAVISYKRGSTSNLLRHMKKKHPEIDVLDEDRLKVEETVDSPGSEDENDDPEYDTVSTRLKTGIFFGRGGDDVSYLTQGRILILCELRNFTKNQLTRRYM